MPGVKSVSLLGSTSPVKFRTTATGLEVQMPDLPDELMSQPAWVLKLSR
jgi:hypothetical protein